MLRDKILCLWLVALLAAVSSHAAVVTLGPAALMSLDYHHSSETLNTTVIEKRLSGNGVEFDVLFSGNTGSDSQMFYGSSFFGGAGALAFEDVSDFDQFQLDVELLDVQGYTPQQAEPLALWFSPMVHDGSSYKPFTAELLSTAVGQNTATASMDISLLSVGEFKKGDLIFDIGYELHMDDPTVWPSDGLTLTLLLSPTGGATQIIPEPISLSFFAIGALGLALRKRSSN